MDVTREQILNLIWTDPVVIGHWLGKDLLNDVNNKWLHDFLFKHENQTLQAHRGAYKSTVISLFLALHTLIKPDETVIYMRKTDADVTEICSQTQKFLQSGCLQKMAMTLYGHDIQLVKANSSEIDTNLKTAINGSPQIQGFGINASITGKHADIVITDDVVTQKDRISRAEREHTKLIFQELMNVKNPKGRLICTGTPWHKDDAFDLMGKASGGHIDKYTCYETGILTPEMIREKRESMAPSLFAANYELKHIADENTLFSDPQWADAGMINAIYDGQGHIDAAYNGEDYTAYTILKPYKDGYIGYGHIWRKHVDQCLPEILALQDKYKVGSISLETNGDKGYLDKELKAHGILTRPYHEGQNKYLKIATHLVQAWPHIYWLPETDYDYIEQICDYTENAGHDDAPDSVASLLRQYKKTASWNTGSYLTGGF